MNEEKIFSAEWLIKCCYEPQDVKSGRRKINNMNWWNEMNEEKSKKENK